MNRIITDGQQIKVQEQSKSSPRAVQEQSKSSPRVVQEQSKMAIMNEMDNFLASDILGDINLLGFLQEFDNEDINQNNNQDINEDIIDFDTMTITNNDTIEIDDETSTEDSISLYEDETAYVSDIIVTLYEYIYDIYENENEDVIEHAIEDAIEHAIATVNEHNYYINPVCHCYDRECDGDCGTLSCGCIDVCRCSAYGW
jgi:hypothetical protein